jgi:hypothetical protein
MKKKVNERNVAGNFGKRGYAKKKRGSTHERYTGVTKNAAGDDEGCYLSRTTEGKKKNKP